MSFDPTISIGEKTFTLSSWNASGSVRIETGSSLAEPDLLLISHETSRATASKLARDAHLVKNQLTIIDSADVPQTANVYVRLDVPRSAAFGNAEIRKMLAAVFGVFLGDDFAMTGITTANQEGLDKLGDVLLGLS